MSSSQTSQSESKVPAKLKFKRRKPGNTPVESPVSEAKFFEKVQDLLGCMKQMDQSALNSAQRVAMKHLFELDEGCASQAAKDLLQ